MLRYFLVANLEDSPEVCLFAFTKGLGTNFVVLTHRLLTPTFDLAQLVPFLLDCLLSLWRGCNFSLADRASDEA